MAKPLLWGGVISAVVVRFALLLLGAQTHLSRRVEVVTPTNSPMRLAEGYWLKKLGLSPYAGSAYHGSPLLLGLMGPLTNNRTGHSNLESFGSFLVFVAADLIGAFLLYSIGAVIEATHEHYVSVLQVELMPTSQANKMAPDTAANSTGKRKENRNPLNLRLGEVAGLLYLLNPFTIAVCVGSTMTPFENMLVILSLYGAVAGNTPLAAFGWAISTHLSLYPAVLIIPISLLIMDGPDRPQMKVLAASKSKKNPLISEEPSTWKTDNKEGDTTGSQSVCPRAGQSWLAIVNLLFWSALWWFCIINLCSLELGGHAHLLEMLTEYFFTEVFSHFRFFFIMVFHANIIVMILPVTIRLHHRPFFLAFIMMAISTLLKSYPSVGDAALTFALMSLCTPTLSAHMDLSSQLKILLPAWDFSGFRFSFLILYGYLFVAFLSPSMYNLWIWRGTGNANFYFAMALVYAAFQSILIVESVGTVIRFDRCLKVAVDKSESDWWMKRVDQT